jgi:hypothetical protein
MLTISEQQEAEQTREQQLQQQLAANKEKEKERLLASFKARKAADDFQQRIVDFHKHRTVNAPLHQLPTFNGKPVDLSLLYNTVISMGGWERVCEKDRWDEVGRLLDSALFAACTNAGHALKIIYIRYLSLYERFDTTMNVNDSLAKNPAATLSSLLDTYSYSNPPLMSTISTVLSHGGNSSSLLNQSLLNSSSSMMNSSSRLQSVAASLLNDDKADSELNRRRFSYLLEAAPMTYNYGQHMSNASQPHHTAYVSTGGRNPYEKLEIALESGLPNEVDFVFNTILLLSSDDSHQFRIYASRRLVDLMLGHCGFFGTEDRHNFRCLYDNVWTAFDRQDYVGDEERGDEQRRDASETMADYLKCEYRHVDEVLKRKFKRDPSRNFVKFWHNVVQFPSEDTFTQKTSISKLLPKLYNNCKLTRLYFHVTRLVVS